MKIFVLRLGHRYDRDDRVTTHVFLVARAFGAEKVIYTGQRDKKLEEGIKEIVKVWGGSFEVEYEKNWEQIILEWQKQEGEVVHLTIYGLPIQEIIHEIKNSPKDKIIVIGGAKVPGIIYKMADWNVSITSQPHSEISALSIFLHEIFQGKELEKTFENANLRVLPQQKGKKILKI